MRLSTPASVLSILAIQSNDGSLGYAGAALDATFSEVEEKLSSFLVKTVREDSFDIDDADVNYPVFRLTSGFVDSGEDIAVYAYDELVDAGDYEIDFTKGMVAMLGKMTAAKRAIRVSYTHGFAKAAPENDSSELTGAPAALKQGGALTAAAFMMLNPANIAKEKARFMAGVTVAGLQLAANKALQTYIRPRGTCVWPVFTAVIT